MKYLKKKKPTRTKPFRKKKQRKLSRMHCMNRRAQKNYDSFSLNICGIEGQKKVHRLKNSAFVHILIFFVDKSEGKIMKIISLVSHLLVGDATMHDAVCTCVFAWSTKDEGKNHMNLGLHNTITAYEMVGFYSRKIHSKKSWNCFKCNNWKKNTSGNRRKNTASTTCLCCLIARLTFAELDAQVRECWWFYLKD